MVLLLGFRQNQRQGQTKRENKMKRLMKVAASAVCVGAMLSFSGCGKESDPKAVVSTAQVHEQKEKDPYKEVIATYKELNAILVSVDEEPAVPEEMVALMEAGMDPREKKALTEKDKAEFIEEARPLIDRMDSVRKYAKLIGKIRAIDPLLLRSHGLRKVSRFIDESNEEGLSDINKAEKVLAEVSKFSKKN